jgi:hypothetical protein
MGAFVENKWLTLKMAAQSCAVFSTGLLDPDRSDVAHGRRNSTGVGWSPKSNWLNRRKEAEYIFSGAGNGKVGIRERSGSCCELSNRKGSVLGLMMPWWLERPIIGPRMNTDEHGCQAGG